MLPHLHHSRFRQLALTRVPAFSSSAVSFTRKLRPNSVEGSRAKETEDEATENEHGTDGSNAEEELDRWLLSGRKKVTGSEIRSYKNPYGHFCKNVAPSFREPSPRNWLGRDAPFPLNPSFKPPTPLSDDLRTQLYRAYMLDPKLNSVRALATRHHLSIKRVDAILRLKGMEEAWKKNKPLQTGYTKGMEHLLGVLEASKRADVDELLEDANGRLESQERYDADEADFQDNVEDDNKARHRYQRLFWESVAEGEEPVMPGVLETHRGNARSLTKSEGRKNLVERAPGRPSIMFIDVGNAFVDEREKERREREGLRRSAVKARRRMKNH